MYPQRVGALFVLDRLPEEGLGGLLDIGFFTTGYLLVDVRKDRLEPLPSFFGSRLFTGFTTEGFLAREGRLSMTAPSWR